MIVQRLSKQMIWGQLSERETREAMACVICCRSNYLS